MQESQSPFETRGGETKQPLGLVVKAWSQSPFETRGGETVNAKTARGIDRLNPLLKLGAVKHAVIELV